MLAALDDLLLRQQLAEMLDCLESGTSANSTRKIALEGKGDEVVGRLSSIHGIGPILGNVIATEIDGIERFGLSEQLSVRGLIPTTSSSGDKTHHGGWSRVATRVALGVGGGGVVAVVRRHFGGSIAITARALKANTAIMITARRMCQIIFCVLHEKRPYQARLWSRNVPGCSRQRRTERVA
ncbi:MAG: transposase [Kiritimatiellae bacterium]|nr:transposase [Kiritimatiellia bacterium]